METLSLTFPNIAIRIIKEQELVIGPLAWQEARKVSGLEIIDAKKGELNIQASNPQETINNLVAQYERIFGKASHEVCKEAVQNIIAGMPAEEIPSSLK